MSAGRPALYNSPEELQKAIDNYFYLCDTKTLKRKSLNKDGELVEKEVPAPEPYTITGLALSLGYCDRQSLYDNEEKEEFSCIIKKARLKVENAYEQCLYSAKPVGAVFALKNMGWKDKQEVENTGTLQITRIELPPKKNIGDPVSY